MPVPNVCATCSPKNKKAMKLKAAANTTAVAGFMTRVETMVAIERIKQSKQTEALDLRLVKETPGTDLIAKLRAHIEREGYHVVDGEPDDGFEGVVKLLERRYKETTSEETRGDVEHFMTERACPTCGNQDIHPFGRGTQRLEAALAARFPQARTVLYVGADSSL